MAKVKVVCLWCGRIRGGRFESAGTSGDGVRLGEGAERYSGHVSMYVCTWIGCMLYFFWNMQPRHIHSQRIQT